MNNLSEFISNNIVKITSENSIRAILYKRDDNRLILYLDDVNKTEFEAIENLYNSIKSEVIK